MPRRTGPDKRVLAALVIALVLLLGEGAKKETVKSRQNWEHRRIAWKRALLGRQQLKNRALSTVVALGASIICNKIPGLAPRQRTICQSRPDAMVAVGEGVKLGFNECRYQFRLHRWNCTMEESNTPASASLLGTVHVIASKEAAFTYAIRSAGVAYAITQACSLGNITSCGCDKSKIEPGQYSTAVGWKWGGCSADIKYGLTFSRIFMDAQEILEDARALMNLHNNRAGRKAVKDKMDTQCKCHGVSGACTTKTCWTTLSSFRAIGDRLHFKYSKAKQVVPLVGTRTRKPVHLKLKRSKLMHKKPRRADSVYLDRSPNYCEYNPQVGSMGTRGRKCNRTSTAPNSCDYMCCGRGYNTYQYVRTWQCNCKFVWCCVVDCETCSKHTEEYTCK